MQRLTYIVSMSLSHNHGKRPFQSCWSTRTISHVHQSCSQTNHRGYWFGNENGRTSLKNGVLRNGQQPGSAGNSFFDYSEFEAMKSLSGWVAARCDEHQFHAKIKVSTWAVFELSLFEQSRNEERIWKMAILLTHTFAFSCLLRGFWATIWVLLITKALKEEAWALK